VEDDKQSILQTDRSGKVSFPLLVFNSPRFGDLDYTREFLIRCDGQQQAVADDEARRAEGCRHELPGRSEDRNGEGLQAARWQGRAGDEGR
jgi:hypothetical protein